MSSAACAPSSSHFECEKAPEQLILAVKKLPIFMSNFHRFIPHLWSKTKCMGGSGKKCGFKVSLYDVVTW